MTLPSPSALPWWQTSVFYQIYPRSFADANGDGLGDLPGVIAHLDYLAWLGVDAIWLSPCFPTPDIDFGYDVSDYCAIDPRMGSMQDLDCLLREAHARGIRVILDLVLNHTSDQHTWFQESRAGRDSPRRDWYLWRDPVPGGGPPNNWQSMFSGSGWTFDPPSGQYYYHTFYRQQPDLNWRCPAVRQALLDVFRFWLDRGVDGFRLDVFNAYFKHPAFPNNPPAFGLRGFDRQRHRYDSDQPEMIPLLNEIRALLDSYPERPGLGGRYVIGETYLPTPGKAAAYMGAGRLHAAFNFDLLKTSWHPRSLMDAVQRGEHSLGDGDWPTVVFNNHDERRSATRWGGGSNDARMKLAATLLLTLRGTPYLYYGEEIGMRNCDPPTRAQVRDSVGRTYWPFYKGRDGCRTPMQWDDSPNAGFSADPQAVPWLPLHPNAAWRNVAAQRQDPASLLNWYRRLIEIRRTTPALTGGMFLPLTHGTRYLLAYLRQTPDQVVLVALNFSRHRQRLVLGPGLARANWRLLLSSHRQQPPVMQRGSLLPLEAGEALIIEMTAS
jgi:alpha-glucosidase